MTRHSLSATLAALLVAAGPAAAQVLTFELTDAAGNLPAGGTVTIAPGSSRTFAAYLAADPTAQSQIGTHGGLVNVFGKLTQGTSALVTSTSAAMTSSGFPANPWQTFSTTGSTATAPVLNDSTFTPLSPAAFGTNGQIGYFLGTVTLTAGPTAGMDVLTFGLRGTSQDVGAADNSLFDSVSRSSTTTFVISPVPEPGSLVLGGMAAIGMAGVVARRRRRVTAASPAHAGSDVPGAAIAHAVVGP